MKYKIGYVDEDPAQYNRFERKLRPYFDMQGYNMSPGTELGNLLTQIYESDIDLLMVDYLMTDKGTITFNGDEVVRKFEEIRPRFPMIIFTNEEQQAFPHVDNPNIIYDKSELEDNPMKFTEVLTKNIKVYQDYVGSKREVLQSLLEKQSAGGLSADERNTLVQIQIELNSLDALAEQEMPYQLLLPESQDKLDQIRKEAEAFLESLNKEKKDGEI